MVHLKRLIVVFHLGLWQILIDIGLVSLTEKYI